MAAVAADIAALQAAYTFYPAHYWQGKTNPPTIPDGGISTTWDASQAIPGHQSWSTFGCPVYGSATIAIEVHEYLGPDGKGYVIVGSFTYGGATYRRATNVGPESWRDHDWQ